MRKVTPLLSVITALTLLAGVLALTSRSVWALKVDPWVLTTAAGGETEFLVYLQEQADLSGAAALPTKQEKGRFVYEQLTAVARRTQPAVIAALKSRSAAYRPFWIANMIWVRADAATVQALARRPDIAHIYANPAVQLAQPQPIDPSASPQAAAGVEWNINHVNAPAVWAQGYTGQGVVIGGQDTGYQWDHPALINQYRGWNGSSADHNFNWHDAIHGNVGPPGINPCGYDSVAPCDDQSHGTHTMGTMVGDDGGSNQIGMAPGARWIGCRNMENGWGSPATYTECYEWFVAPYPIGGNPLTDGDPGKAPHVINNSWACPTSEGCTDPNVLLTVVENVRAAGILTVHAAGNEGPGCSSVATPATIYDASFSVAALNSADAVANFSSRGPVIIDDSNRMKPDISAPGVSIRSSIPTNLYQGGWSGTSMAAPHVAGLAALMISVEPGLAGQVDALESLIQNTAVQLTTSQSCGEDSPSAVPNNTFGYGRIDALAAYEGTKHTLAITTTTPVTFALPGGTITYTFTVTHNHVTTGTNHVVLTDTLPPGTTFITATLPHLFDGQKVRWDLGTMAANTSQSLQLSLQLPLTATGVVTSGMALVSSDDVTTPVSGTAVSTPILPFNLALSKSAAAIAQPGAVLTYSLTITNTNAAAATHHVLLTDTLPANTLFLTATAPYTLSSSIVRWEWPSLSGGEHRTVELVVQLPVTLTAAAVENVAYGARSDEAPDAVMGAPVTTTLLLPRVYLPFVRRE